MIHLIRLELKRNHIKTYLTAALAAAAVLEVFLYLLAFIPLFDPSEEDMGIFQNYSGLSTLICMLFMVTFGILSSVMYSRFIVEEYSGKRALLLFSYPVSRPRIFWAKMSLVFLFTVCSMFLSGTAVFGVFYLTEVFFPLSKDLMTPGVIMGTEFTLLLCSLMAGVLSILSLWLGFTKKSTPVTIVSGVMIMTAACQFLAVFLNHPAALPKFLAIGSFTVVFLIFALILSANLAHKIDRMEVE